MSPCEAASWSRVEHVVARVEAGPDSTDTRFIITSLTGGNGRSLYQGIYCQRGQAENHIKSWKVHLAADRTSCHAATANQFRLFLHAGAYWLLWSLRALMPKCSVWRVAQFDTLRLRLIKMAARVIEMKTMIKVHLPSQAQDPPRQRRHLRPTRDSHALQQPMREPRGKPWASVSARCIMAASY